MKRLLWTLLILGLIASAAAAGVVGWAWYQLHLPYQSYAGDEISLVVTPGTSATAILKRLEASGVIQDRRTARLYLIHHLEDPALKAGEYRFSGPMNTPRVLDKLIRGEVVTHSLTLIEGLTLDEAAQAIADAGFGELETLRREMADPARIRELDAAAENLEGYLYPETYHFAKGTTEAEIVDTLVATFKRRAEDQVLPLLAETPDLPGLDGLRDVVTLASIVEKETQRDDERELVAGVYRNRLRIGMGLYADPTLIYGKKIEGTWDGNLRRVDLRTDGPYNTYMRPGLPPSPICSPSVASMVAALRPAETKYLYFVSRNDGTHVFAETKREHDRNVHKWQKVYWRKKRAEARAEKAKGVGKS